MRKRTVTQWNERLSPPALQESASALDGGLVGCVTGVDPVTGAARPPSESELSRAAPSPRARVSGRVRHARSDVPSAPPTAVHHAASPHHLAGQVQGETVHREEHTHRFISGKSPRHPLSVRGPQGLSRNNRYLSYRMPSDRFLTGTINTLTYMLTIYLTCKSTHQILI